MFKVIIPRSAMRGFQLSDDLETIEIIVKEKPCVFSAVQSNNEGKDSAPPAPSAPPADVGASIRSYSSRLGKVG